MTFLQRYPELIRICSWNYCIFEAWKCWWTIIEMEMLELLWQRSDFGVRVFRGKGVLEWISYKGPEKPPLTLFLWRS